MATSAQYQAVGTVGGGTCHFLLHWWQVGLVWLWLLEAALSCVSPGSVLKMIIFQRTVNTKCTIVLKIMISQRTLDTQTTSEIV